ncbi:DUF3088 domain-containing protein [Sphingomonas psychrotolerans]|uniref:DUF3088 domain-containing protein n=1 Tax=Sphingomonas psychrotolerans TaxID=1327635 RepID=A0ABU3N142_9SPHN|nr:DUF3088 family protein [Sphingomonas psychrotolerans]MDT8757569.1 DUF3088 domain-containing protein [Sphingomonas psychrotolerans]
MTRDTLFLLEHDFADPAFGGERIFYCKDCMTIEGLLAVFPECAANIDVVRVAWPRPRAAVVAAIGAENQNLPALVWREPDGSFGFANEIEALLAALAARHGFPERHP